MSSGDDGGDGILPSFIWRFIDKAAEVPMGGIVAFSLVSSATITDISYRNKEKQGWEEQSSSSSPSLLTQKLKDEKACEVCKGKGFYQCKLCKGNSTIEWSPLFDPVFINPCLCPTCDGNRIQRCLNCLGKGILSGR